MSYDDDYPEPPPDPPACPNCNEELADNPADPDEAIRGAMEALVGADAAGAGPRCDDDAYAAGVAGAIGAFDASDGSEFYVRAFVVADGVEPVSVWLWNGSEYEQTTRTKLLASWWPEDEEVPA